MQERKRFASDLHDGMGQLVSALQLNIQSIKQNKDLQKAVAQVETSEQLLGEIQNEIRNIALGRKNWLFINNQDSGKIHALFYSLILSAIMNNLNPRLYIHYLIMQIHHLRKKTIDPKTLLPHTIDRNALKTFAEKLLAEAKEIIDAT